MKNRLFILIILILAFLFPGCTESPQKSSAEISAATPTAEATPDSAPSPTPSPTPTPEPIEIILPSSLAPDAPLFFGMSKEDVKGLFGEPQLDFNYGQNLDVNNLVNFTYKIGEHEDASITFIFYEYDSPDWKHSYGLNEMWFSWNSKYTNCEDFLVGLYPELTACYGEPTKDVYELIEWDANKDKKLPSVQAKLDSVPNKEFKDDSGTYSMSSAVILFSNPFPFEEQAEKDYENAFVANGQQGVNLVNYSLLHEGMSLKDVQHYLGIGELVNMDQKIGSDSYTYYQWESVETGLITIQFRDGKVSLITRSGY